MTAIIGVNLVEYVIIAADVRVTTFGPGGIVFQDAAQKIRKTPVGLSAAAGCADLIENVWAGMGNLNTFCPREISDLINQEADKLKARTDISPREATRAINSTVWMFTGKSDRAGSISMHLDLHAPRGTMKTVDANRVFAQIPGAMPLEQTKKLLDLVSDKVIPLSRLKDLRRNFEYHFDFLGDFIKDVSKRTTVVSRKYQVGVHHISSGTGISRVAEVGELTLTLPDA
jgi:hypothetical protein